MDNLQVLMIDWLVIIGYGASLSLIFLFSLGQLHLAIRYRKNKKATPATLAPLADFPLVAVQLPIYNELYVVERLIRQVCLLDYPKDKLEIQVLDDSDDETCVVVDNLVEEYKKKGFDIKTLRWQERTGFKAGALQNGLEQARAEFIAIFDADFLPDPQFLKETLPHFTTPKVGMVQTRWGHLNRNYSWLTKLQAFGLDAHFSVEQTGRSASGSFINFNGTGGIWRKECIVDGGGWTADTLTEDLDLSYRAQLKGWHFTFLENVESPAELPILMPAVKSQQYRWNKGAAETARKNLGAVLTSALPLKNKLHAVQHLLNSSLFFFLFTASLLSLPLLYTMNHLPTYSTLFNAASVFVLGFLFVSYFYWVASGSSFPKKTLKYFLVHFPMFITFSMGMSLHNAIAVLEGWLGIKTPFLRTPKFNVLKDKISWKTNKYVNWKLTPAIIVEGLLAVYFAFGLWSAFYLYDFGLIFFHLMLTIGFGGIFLLSIKPYGFAASKG
ncbi:MAG: glycosyltransferase [Imperialibacter sp.]